MVRYNLKKFSSNFVFIRKEFLLIDADLKRGSLAKDLNARSISEETFYKISSSNLDKYKISDNFINTKSKGSSKFIPFYLQS